MFYIIIKNGYQKISTNNLIGSLSKSLNNNLLYIQAFIKFQNKISYSIYDSITIEKINIRDKCLKCKEYQITNNYTNIITNYIGTIMLNLVQSENIDLFNEKENIFNDICHNLTINNFDYPLKERKSKFYLGNSNNKNIILCGDENCNLIKDNKNNSTSICSCPIEDNNDDINNILNIQKNESIFENIYLNNIENNIEDNMLYIFKCITNSFKLKNIKNNIVFILSAIIIGVQIICFISLSICSFSSTLKKLPLNPPKKNEIEEKNNITNNQKNIGIDSADIDIKTTDQSSDIRIGNMFSKQKYGKISYDLLLDYLSFQKAKKTDKRSFCYYYFHLLFFNQLILNLLSCCIFSISISFIPFPLKLIKILFLYLINLFINVIMTNNKYMIDKYNYFNEKYDIENNEINPDINEKILYSIKNGKTNILISFIVCLVLQYILGCLLNIRKKIANILLDEKSRFGDKDKKIIKIKDNLSCMINSFAIICLLIMIVILIFLTNYCVIFNGMIIDIISQSISSFIILQICPFVICFFVSLLRTLGLKYNCRLFFLLNKCLSGL